MPSIERVARNVGIGKRGKQPAGDDLTIVELRDDLAKPQTASGDARDEHAHKRKQNRAANALGTLALAGTLGIAGHVRAAVNATARFVSRSAHLLYGFFSHK